MVNSRNKGSQVRKVLKWLPDYDISEEGEVRRITPAKTRGAVPYIIVGGDNARGYRRVKLSLPDGSKKQFLISHLVCEAFYGPRPTPKHHCAHWDGDCGNDRASNLRWATPIENVGRDRARHGRSPKGERNGRSVITQNQAKEIKRRYTGEYGQVAALSREFGLSYSATLSICKGERWTHV